MYKYTHNLWLVPLVMSYENTISSALVKMDYMVGPVIEGCSVANGVALAYALQTNKSLNELNEDIVKLITIHRLKVHFFLVTTGNFNAYWSTYDLVSKPQQSSAEKETQNILNKVNDIIKSHSQINVAGDKKRSGKDNSKGAS